MQGVRSGRVVIETDNTVETGGAVNSKERQLKVYVKQNSQQLKSNIFVNIESRKDLPSQTEFLLQYEVKPLRFVYTSTLPSSTQSLATLRYTRTITTLFEPRICSGVFVSSELSLNGRSPTTCPNFIIDTHRVLSLFCPLTTEVDGRQG